MAVRSAGEQADTADIVKSHGSALIDISICQVMLLVFLHVFAGFMASQKGLQVSAEVSTKRNTTQTI